MAAYAETSDLELILGRSLDDAEKERAEKRLEDAGVIIDTAFVRTGGPEDVKDDLWLLNASRISCDMVARAIRAPSGMDGISSFQQTAGPFSGSFTVTNPLGNLYLTKAEKEMLGLLPRQRMYSIAPMMGADDEDPA